MLDAVHWIGGSGNWSDPSHWGSHVPGGNDVAIIDATGPNYTVTLDTSPTVAGFMLNSATATFSASSGALTVNGDATLSAGVVLWTNSIWTGSGKLTNSANMIFQGSDTINNSFTNAAGATLRVQGASIGYGSLSSANGFTNNGTIELTNNISGAAYGASLTVSSGTLVNAGTLNILPGLTESPRTLAADLLNQGTVNVNTDTDFSKSGGVVINSGTFSIAAGQTFTISSLDQTFNQEAGTLNIAGSFDFSNGTFGLDGGMLVGNAPVLTSSTVSIGPHSTATGTVLVQGSSTLRGDVAAGQTIVVQGASGSYGSLSSANGFTNNGTIELTNNISGAAYGASLTVSSGTLVNAGTLNILPGLTESPRTLTTQLDNQGTLTVSQALTLNSTGMAQNEGSGVISVTGGDLSINQSGTEASFSNNGTITVASGHTLSVSGGRFNPGTGIGNGVVQMSGATLGSGTIASALTVIVTNGSEAADATLVNQGLLVVQGSDTFSGTFTNGAGATLRVQGASGGYGSLSSANGFTNNGTIELTNNISGAAYGASLTVSSGTLVNAGTLNILPGLTESPRTLAADLLNQGTVNVNTDTDFSNPFNNSAAGSVLVHAGTLALSGGGTSNGSFSADAGATLSIASNYILQTGASETGSGTLLIDSGMLTAGADVSVQNLILAGGTLTGAGTVTVSGLMTWTGGSMAGTGVTNVARGGFLNINGGSTYTGLRTINNEGMNISVNPSNVFVSTDSTFTQLESFVASGLQTLANDLGLPYGNLIPLLGHALNTIPGSLINEVTPGLPKTIKGISLSAIQQDLFQVFGPPGLDILRLNGSAPEFIPILNSDGMVAITLPIGRSFTVQAPFDLGLPGLPLKLNASGSVQGSVDVNLNLNFSVAQLAGQSPSFQIEPSFIQAEVMASVPGLMASARAGLLQAEATDDPKHPSSLLLIYLTNFATDPSGGLMVSTTTNGSATVNLLLSASFGSDPVNDPTITSNFNLDWSFSNADPAQSSPFGNTPNIAFNNVQLHLGSFVGDFLAPVLSDVQVLTRRLDPLAKFLLQEVPVISDLSRDVGSGPIYLANLIPEYGETIVRFAMAVEVINGLDSNALRTGVVSLGNFTVTDPRATDSAGDAPPAGILQDNAAPDVIAQISGLSPDAANFFDQLSMLGSSDTLHFTILDDPTNAFDLLIGRDTTLFSYTVTPLMISDTVFTYDIPVYPGVVVHFQGDLNFSVSATFGCDSSGLHGGNILDSFYLQNVSIMVGFTVEAGPGVGIPDLFTVSVDGGLGVSATFTLTGTDGNPRLTWSELADGQYTVSDSGDVQGSLSIDVTSLGMDLYSFTLASFDRHIF